MNADTHCTKCGTRHVETRLADIAHDLRMDADDRTQASGVLRAAMRTAALQLETGMCSSCAWHQQKGRAA